MPHYLVSRRVRHVAVWAGAPEVPVGHRWITLCDHPSADLTFRLAPPNWTVDPFVMNKPICRNCQSEARRVAAVAELGES